MIRAYDKSCLEKAQIALASMLDFAVNNLGYSTTEFYNLFLRSTISDRFGNGESKIILGYSGVELAYEVLLEANIPFAIQNATPLFNKSTEYWTGWALAYYQWETSLSFAEINRHIPIDEIALLYYPYHEMDILQTVDMLNRIYRSRKKDTNLKLMRNRFNLSQRELAELSGIPLRTIQQYEQRQKNINKAQAEYLVSLSKVLCCDVMELLELPSYKPT